MFSGRQIRFVYLVGWQGFRLQLDPWVRGGVGCRVRGGGRGVWRLVWCHVQRSLGPRPGEVVLVVIMWGASSLRGTATVRKCAYVVLASEVAWTHTSGEACSDLLLLTVGQTCDWQLRAPLTLFVRR